MRPATFQGLGKIAVSLPGIGKSWDRFSRPWNLALVLLFAACAHASALDLYILRHAETMANVTGIHTDEMAGQFSPRGLEQVDAVTTNLAALAPDAVICSPLWRTRRTVLPYLQAAGATAELWPELEECCWQSDKDAPPTENRPAGPLIALEPDEDGRFSFRDGTVSNRFGAVTFSDGVEQVREAARLIRERYGGRDVKLLVVTHFHTGARLVELLRGEEPRGRYAIPNAKLVQLEELPDGRFRVVTRVARLRGE